MLYFWHMHKKLLLFTTYLVIAAASKAQEKWGLRKCVEYAWQNNINVMQQDVQAKLAAVSEQQAKLAKYPNANFNTNAGMQFGRSIDPTTNQFTTTQLAFQNANLNADIVIFNWNRVKNTLLASQTDTKAAWANVEKAKNDIALSVATAFLQALLNKEQVGVAKIQFEQTKNQLEATRRRVAAGALPELNAVELEAQLARDSTSIINAEATASISLLQLKAFMNMEADLPFDIDAPPVELIPVDKIADLQPDAVFALAMGNQPAQKVNQLRLQSSQLNVKVAKASLYPTISGFGGLSTIFSNPLQKITDVNFNGYAPVNPFNSAINIGGVFVPVQDPSYTFVRKTKSFGEVWQGYGSQLNQNFRQNLGFTINVPIFNGSNARTGYERAKLNVKSAELVIKQADQQLKQDVYQAYANALAAMQRYNGTVATFAASEKTYEFARKRHDVGLLGTFELITNQNNLNTARMNKLIAQYEYVFRMKVLEFYKGQGLKL
jgi:outer membrane protein